MSSGEAGPSWPRANGRNSAAITAVAMPAGEKLGLLGSHNAVPRQNPKSKGLLVKLGLLGPEQRTRPAPAIKQLQKLLVKLGLLGSPSAVPRQHPKLQSLVVKPGPLGPEQMAGILPPLQQP